MARGKRKNPSGKRWQPQVPAPSPPVSKAKPPSGIQVAQASFFQGPLPPPEDLQKFKEVDPSFPERIIAMAERQAGHRQALELRQVKVIVRARYLGLGTAFLSVLAICALAAYAFQLGHAVEAAGMVTGVVVGLVVAFIKGSKVQREG